MIGYLTADQEVQFTIKFGLETKQIWGTVIQYLGNQEYEIEGENGNRYIRKMVWEPCNPEE